MLSCSANIYRPTCEDFGNFIRCEYVSVKKDGSQSKPVHSITPRVVECDPRVRNRVQRHIDDRSGSFRICELVGKPGFATWQPRQLFVTPSQITFRSIACATAPPSFTSYPLSSQSNASLYEADDKRTIVTLHPGLVLHLSSETSLKRDVLVMLLRHWMYVMFTYDYSFLGDYI